MEPGHEDREYPGTDRQQMETIAPQWSPVMKTGNTARVGAVVPAHQDASMEPGHEDREYMMGEFHRLTGY